MTLKAHVTEEKTGGTDFVKTQNHASNDIIKAVKRQATDKTKKTQKTSANHLSGKELVSTM